MKPRLVFTLMCMYLLAHALLSEGCTPFRRIARRVNPGTHYVVRSGDTLWEIAEIHEVPLELLISKNKIHSARSLQAGQKLYIPKYRENSSYKNSSGSKSRKSVASRSKKYDKKRKVEYDTRSIKLKWPVKNGVQFRKFSDDPENLYEGIGIGAPTGSNVRAASAGKVIFVGDQGNKYGNVVILKNKDPFVTIYAHLSKLKVKPGQQIKTGDLLGEVGTTGDAESPCVQLQLRKNRVAVDPRRYLQ